MILNLEKREFAILAVSLQKVSRSVKRSARRQYGKNEGDERFQSFSSIIEQIKQITEKEKDKDDKVQQINLQLDANESSTLHSFLDWYLENLENNKKQYRDEIRMIENIYEKMSPFMVTS